MPGPNRPETQKPLSQTQGFGMVPVYQAPQSRGADRGPPVLIGYEFNPYKAGLTTVDTPKPPAILAVEQQLGGKQLEPIYATYTQPGRGRGGSDTSVAYGPPIGYRYDNGQSQYVNFDATGQYQGTADRQNLGTLIKDLAPLALAALGANFLVPMLSGAAGGAGLLGAEGATAALGAGQVAAAAPLAFTPEMIAAGLAPGSIGAAGAASGALTGANLAAASGIGSLGAGAAAIPSINEMIASGMSPGSAGASGAASGALTPAQLAAASGAAEAGVASLAPTAAKSVNEMVASGMSPGSAGAAGAAEGLLTAEQLAAAAGTTGTGVASLAPAAKSVNEMVASGMSPGSAGAAGAAEGLLTAEQLAAASGAAGAGITSLAPAAAKSVNEMIASGMSPGSAGAAGAASGALTPAQLAAASGAVTAGATPALVELANAGKGLPSANEAVASGLGPGSAGAKAAVEGTLTAQELAAAAGTAGALNKDGITDLVGKAKDALTDKAKDASSGSGGSGIGALGALALLSMMNKGGGGTPASTATIPELTATRSQLPYDVDKKGVNPNTPYRPGQGGVTYFSPTTYTPVPPKAAGGGLMSLGQPNLGGYSDGGRLLKGPGDGVSDSIPAIIGKKQPARLANGEFVIPARIVSELGNGSTDAGAKRLYAMMDRIQKVRRKTKNVAANTKASKYLPA